MSIPFLRRADTHTHELVWGSAIAFVVKAVAGALSFAFNVVLARVLGASGVGSFAIGFTVATIASVVGRVGLDNVLLRQVAANAAAGDWSAVRGAFRRSLEIALAASVGTSVLVIALAPALAARVFQKPEIAGSIRLMAYSILPFVLLMLIGEALKGLQRVFASSMVQGVIGAVIALAGVWWLAPRWGLPAAIWSYTVGCAAAAVAGLWFWQRATPELRGVRGTFSRGALIRSGAPLFWVATMSLALSWTGTLALGVWGTKAEVGIYSAAYRTAFLISFVLTAVNSIAGAKFAALYRRGDLTSLTATVRNSTRLMVLWGAPVTLLFVLAPRTVLHLFGEQFTDGAGALVILSLGQFLNVAAGSMGKLLMMTGHERETRNIVTITGLTNIVLTLVLVPHFRVLGAAIAAGVGLGVQNLLATWVVYRVLRIKPAVLTF